jgi:predicted nucleic acid-binding protein
VDLIVDTGPLYASIDKGEPRHRECLLLFETHPGPVVVPALTIAEVAYFISDRLGAYAETLLLADLAAGTYTVDAPAASDWLRIAQLVAHYRDLPLGTVDASVIASAERRRSTQIATFDRRHFTIVRPSHVDAFELLP